MSCSVFQLQELWTNVTTAQAHLFNMFLNALQLKPYKKVLKPNLLKHKNEHISSYIFRYIFTTLNIATTFSDAVNVSNTAHIFPEN